MEEENLRNLSSFCSVLVKPGGLREFYGSADCFCFHSRLPLMDRLIRPGHSADLGAASNSDADRLRKGSSAVNNELPKAKQVR